MSYIVPPQQYTDPHVLAQHWREHDERIRIDVLRILCDKNDALRDALAQAPTVYKEVTGRTWERTPQDAPAGTAAYTPQDATP
jgi:hypothetical protein